MNYDESMKKLATGRGLGVVRLVIDGQFKPRGKERGRAEFVGPVGPETEKLVWELFTRLCREDERMK